MENNTGSEGRFQKHFREALAVTGNRVRITDSHSQNTLDLASKWFLEQGRPPTMDYALTLAKIMNVDAEWLWGEVTFELRLMQAIKKKGLSVDPEILATQIKISQGLLRMCLAGQFRPPMKVLKRLAKKLEVEVEWLKGDESPETILARTLKSPKPRSLFSHQLGDLIDSCGFSCRLERLGCVSGLKASEIREYLFDTRYPTLDELYRLAWGLGTLPWLLAGIARPQKPQFRYDPKRYCETCPINPVALRMAMKRINKDMTTTFLSFQTNIKASRLDAYLSGTEEASSSDFIALSKFLGVDQNVLYSYQPATVRS